MVQIGSLFIALFGIIFYIGKVIIGENREERFKRESEAKKPIEEEFRRLMIEDEESVKELQRREANAPEGDLFYDIEDNLRNALGENYKEEVMARIDYENRVQLGSIIRGLLKLLRVSKLGKVHPDVFRHNLAYYRISDNEWINGFLEKRPEKHKIQDLKILQQAEANLRKYGTFKGEINLVFVPNVTSKHYYDVDKCDFTDGSFRFEHTLFSDTPRKRMW